jgi:hypothetical protein
MKKIVYILVFVFSFSNISFAQDDDGGGKLRDKMIEYIQTKLGLSKSEAEKFQPVFLDYLKDMRATKQQYKDGDRLVLQQKIIDLRIRYRDQFKPIIGEARSNQVFKHEHDFVEQARTELKDRLDNRLDSRANKKSGLLQ